MLLGLEKERDADPARLLNRCYIKTPADTSAVNACTPVEVVVDTIVQEIEIENG
jgi:hypothetical protein